MDPSASEQQVDLTPPVAEQPTPNTVQQPIQVPPPQVEKVDARRRSRTAGQIASLQKAQEARKAKQREKLERLAVLQRQADEDKELEEKLFAAQQREREIRNQKLRVQLAVIESQLKPHAPAPKPIQVKHNQSESDSESASESETETDSGSEGEQLAPVAPAPTRRPAGSRASLRPPGVSQPSTQVSNIDDFSSILRD
jgi:hypothetical protein